jgi:glutaredoxin
MLFYNRPMHEVRLYSRRNCHLCHVVKETLRRLQSAADFSWQEVDIDSDPELQRLYDQEVPVVFIDGRKAFKYRMDASEFLRKLERS